MDAIDRHELLSEAINLLDKREADREGIYWFCGDGADESLTYCYDCIKAIMPNAKRGDDFMGGASNYENDGCESCERCFKPLGYVLTDYGVESELANFIEYGFDWNSPDECYEMARIVHGMVSDDPRRDQVLQVLLSGKNVPTELVPPVQP